MSLLTLLLLLAYICLSRSCSPLHRHPPPSFPLPDHGGPAAGAAKKSIFILAGQSNMAGRGGVTNGTWDHVVPPECQPIPSIQRLSAGLQWEEAREPLHADIDVNKTNGVGPGMAFANEIIRSCGSGEVGVIGLVPCAIGGTRIDEWVKGSPLYDTTIRRAMAALAAGGGTITAVLWYQGESDTVSREDAEAYKGKMESLIRDLRSDLGYPGLLVIQVALASGEGPFINIVREAQLGIKLPNVYVVDAKGLPLGEDHVHLTTPAQVKLGKMLAVAYLEHDTDPHH